MRVRAYSSGRAGRLSRGVANRSRGARVIRHSHLAKLEDAGLVAIEKRFVRKKPNTNVALTAEGKQRIKRHWEQLERLKRLSGKAAPT